MAKFHVYPNADGGYWLDCQSDFLSGLNSRFVVPLQPVAKVPGGDRRLNPVFEIDGAQYVMQTHYAGAISATLLGKSAATLIDHEFTIGMALDMLLNGF